MRRRMRYGLPVLLCALALSGCSTTGLKTSLSGIAEEASTAETDTGDPDDILMEEASADVIAAEEETAETDTGDPDELPIQGAIAADTLAVTVNSDGAVQPLTIAAGTHYDYKYSNKYDTCIAEMSYPIIQLGESEQTAYPKLASAITKLNNKERKAQKAQYKENVTTAKQQLASEGSEDFITYRNLESVTCRRADSVVTSFVFEGENYWGGVHGAYYYTGVTLDTQTGKTLKLKNIVADRGALAVLVEEALYQYYDPAEFYDDIDLVEYITSDDTTLYWVLDDQGLTFYFNAYDIAPYASGTQTVTISYAEHPEVFKSKYMEVPDSYGVDFSYDSPFYFDVDNDGDLDQILISGSLDEYGYMYEQSISLNGKTRTDDAGCYSLNPMLIHTADGSNYLYLEGSQENDYRMMEIYNLSTGKVKKVKAFYSGLHSVYSEDDGAAIYTKLTNPNLFLLDTRTEVLSTVTGTKVYAVGEKGIPVSEDTLYSFTSPIKLKLKRSLKMTRYSNGVKGKKKTLKKGTILYYTGTNNKKTCELTTKSGITYRIALDSNSWPKTIHDTDIEDIFDGTIFAG